MRILALDVGTSSVKAAILEAESDQPAGSIFHENYALDHPTAEAAEVPAERLWRAVTNVSARAARELPDAGDSVTGIGLAVLTPALVLLDNKDRPLAPIWTHLDRRSRMQARHVWQALGQEFMNTTGNRPWPGGMSVLSYSKQINDDPYLTNRIHRLLHVNGWLGLKMTGTAVFDPGNACVTGLFDTMGERRWSTRWCDYFEVDRAWLPPVLTGDSTLGSLRSAAATELGVPAGVPVKVGVADTSSAALSAELSPRDLLHVIGTTQVVATLIDKPKPNPELLTRLLGVGERYLQIAHNPVGGIALDWIRELCFRDLDRVEFFAKTVPQAAEREPDVLLDPPYLGGDRLQIEAIHAAFVNLKLTTDRMDLLAAVLCAMREEHRKAVSRLRSSDAVQRIFVTGGGDNVVRQLLPEYESADVHLLADGSLKGVAKLFANSA